ncbi:hypothetical protein AEMCBJ_32505 (plasmid) [Cupriavidus necator]
MNAGVQTLRGSAQARVLAFGVWLKNRACLLDGHTVQRSPQHGDLGTPEACRALEVSTGALAASPDGRIDAVARDLYPDFESTRLALAWSDQLGVLAIAVQHHHARIAVVPAKLGSRDAVIGPPSVVSAWAATVALGAGSYYMWPARAGSGWRICPAWRFDLTAGLQDVEEHLDFPPGPIPFNQFDDRIAILCFAVQALRRSSTYGSTPH